ncbi:MAG: hypothetical protein M3R21_07810 [Candidatus Dormibacteraeota bacterium]|nr:hypothetical protein [Candidatus Dormibacteraeota bacterium]
MTLNWYFWLKFLHLGAVFAFLFTHGISGGASLLLRGQRALATRQLLLETSYRAMEISTPSLFVILLSGIALGFYGTWWGRGWIWAALVIFLVVSGVMGYFSFRHDDARKAAGLAYRVFTSAKRRDPVPPDPDLLEREIPRLRIRELTAVGTLGLLLILWLMVIKPF